MSKSVEFVCLNIKQSIFVVVMGNTYPCMHVFDLIITLMLPIIDFITFDLIYLILFCVLYINLMDYNQKWLLYMLQILLYLIIAVCCSLILVQRLTSNMLQHECRVTQSNWSSIWNHGNTCRHTNYAEAWCWIIRDATIF